MTTLGMLARRLAALFAGRRFDRDLAEELRIHVEMAAEAAVADGMSPDEARAAARRGFGNATRIREDARGVWRFQWIESAGQDIRYACRTLARTPAFTLVSVLSLALAIGANSAIFTLANAMLLRALPVPDANRLVALESATRSADATRLSSVFSYPAFESLRARTDLFATLFASRNVPRVNVVTSAGGDAELADGRLVTGGYFEALGVRATLGRALGPADDGPPGASAVTVVSDAFWRSRLGADSAAIGRTIRLEGRPYTIVGVMPRGFFGEWIGTSPAFWVPMAMQPALMGRNQLGEIDHDWLIVMARLRGGATAAETQSRLDAFLRERAADGDRVWLNVERIVAAPGARGPISDMRRMAGRPLAILSATVAVVLLIACANLANLLLARAGARQQEIAVRLAIGAGRPRIVRQLLTESVVLAAAGCVIGLLVAFGGASALLRLLTPPQAAITLDLTPDARVLGYTIAVAALTALAFGLAPAWTAARIQTGAAFGTARHGGGFGSRRLRLGRLLVMAEVGLSICLLAGALLFARSLRNLTNVDPGFARDQVVLAALSPMRLSASPVEITAFYRRLLERVEALPGVESASLARHVMLGGGMDETVLRSVPGFVPQHPRDLRITEDIVGPRYFETTGIALRSGRDFGHADVAGTPRVVILNEAAARFYFGRRNPIGEHIVMDRDALYEIVGVAQDAKYNKLRDPAPRMLYRPALQAATSGSLTLHVRTAADPPALARDVRRAVRDLDERIAVADVTTQSAVVHASLAEERTIAVLCGAFGIIAVALACIGIYGLLSYRVVQRIPELGVRLALGAQRGDVTWLVLRDVVLLVGAGVAAGVPAAIGLMHLARALLFELTPGDPATLSAAVLALGAVAFAAAYLPARRAAGIDPIKALRYE